MTEPAEVPATQEAPPPPGPPAVKMEKSVDVRVFEIVEGANRAYCIDADSAARCVDVDKRLQQVAKAVTDRHKSMADGMNAAKKIIDAEKRTAIEAIDAARGRIQAMILEYRAKERAEAEAAAAEQRKEAEQRALEEAEKLAAQGKTVEADRVLEEGVDLAEGVGAVHPTGPLRGTMAGAASFIEVVQVEIEDEWKVPRAFCRPDMALLRDAVRRKDKPLTEIPGCKVWKEEKMANR